MRWSSVDASEHQIQTAFFDHIAKCYSHTFLATLIFAVPNGGHRDIRTAVKLKREGVKPGVCDVLCLVPRGLFAFLAIEFKKKGKKPTKEQENFMSIASKYGLGSCHVCHSADDAIIVLQNYLERHP